MPLPNEILETLPEELRDNETISRFNSVEDLAKGFIETKSLVGSSLRIPQPEAGDEARTEFLNKVIRHAPELMLKPEMENPEQSKEFFRTLGMPEEPDGYQNPEDLSLNADVENELRTVLHEAGVTNAQYQNIMAAFAQRETETRENFDNMRKQQEEELKGKWGQTFDERTEFAKKINEQFYPGRDFDSLTTADIEGLYQVHKAVNGQKPQGATQPATPSDKLPPAEAMRRANEIMNNPEYWDQANPNQQALVQKRLEYLKMAGMSDSLDDLRPRSL